MNSNVFVLKHVELTDPMDPLEQLRANGDLLRAKQDDCAHFFYNLAAFDPGSVSVTCRWVSVPTNVEGIHDPRLSIYLIGKAHREEAGEPLSLLLGSGPLHRFCKFRHVEEPSVELSQFSAACDVVRRHVDIEPVVTSELNVNARSTYECADPFEPNCGNDDRLLTFVDSLQWPCVIDYCFEPFDAALLREKHAEYLSCLQQMNRTWDDNNHEAYHRNWGSDDRFWQSCTKPLRQVDPWAEEILRRLRRLTDTLTRPHLAFHVRVFAPSKAQARLLASVVAESAFENGSYELFDSARGDSHFERAICGQDTCRVVPVPVPSGQR